MDEETHQCTQAVSIATMCVKLENIERALEEMKLDQKALIEQIMASNIRSASYPSPPIVSDYLKKVDRHDVYFGIIGTAVTLISGQLLGIWQKIFGGA